MLVMGRDDKDVETFTTCSHEVALEDTGRGNGVFWEKGRDVWFLDEAEGPVLHDAKTAFIWGGKTGIKFGRVGTLCMKIETLNSLGPGTGIMWESLECLWVLVEGLGNFSWREWDVEKRGNVARIVKNSGLRNAAGGEVKVDFLRLGVVGEDVEGMGMEKVWIEGEEALGRMIISRKRVDSNV